MVAGGAALSAPAGADSAASSGSFNPYASGAPAYADISGHAQLVRTGDGRTIASVELHGLTANSTYAVHVHEFGCADLAGHYHFSGPVPDGDSPAGNEIWPGPVTANAAGNARGHTDVGAAAGMTARSIVVHATPTGGTRVACADLS